MKILLFGGSGLVGSGIKQLLSNRYQIVAPTRTRVDVTNREQVIRIIDQTQPSTIIYAVGLTSVDQAERNPELTYLLNAEAPAFIAERAKSLKTPILYFSTDAVFDGTKVANPYVEDDKTTPVSVYGKSKLLGEQMIMDVSSQNYIVRIIMPYSHMRLRKKTFVQFALDTLKKGKQFSGIIDQIVNPIYIRDLAEAIYHLIENKRFGIYHLGATDYVTNFEFVKKLAKHFNLNENLVIGISFEDFFKEKVAPRTKFCWLDTSKFRKKFGENILHSVDESIKLFKMNFSL